MKTAVGLDGECQFPPDLRPEVEAAVQGLPDFWRSVTALSARTFVQTSLSPPGHSTTTASKPVARAQVTAVGVRAAPQRLLPLSERRHSRPNPEAIIFNPFQSNHKPMGA